MKKTREKDGLWVLNTIIYFFIADNPLLKHHHLYMLADFTPTHYKLNYFLAFIRCHLHFLNRYAICISHSHFIITNITLIKISRSSISFHTTICFNTLYTFFCIFHTHISVVVFFLHPAKQWPHIQHLRKIHPNSLLLSVSHFYQKAHTHVHTFLLTLLSHILNTFYTIKALDRTTFNRSVHNR